jgi:hypothetical protein
MIRTVEKMSSKNNSRELVLSAALKNYKSKIYITRHKTKNMYYNS